MFPVLATYVFLLTVPGVDVYLDEDSAIPDLAPPIENTLEFEFIDDVHRKRYLKSLFIEAFYEPNCDAKPNAVIRPVYFWPGQRVDLRCIVCRRAFAYNGLMKHWWFMPSKHVEDALDDLNNLKNSRMWVRDLSVMSAEYGDNRWSHLGSMPGDFERGTTLRAQTTIVQRRGMLILLQPTSENEGLYRCLDMASRNAMHFVYYLIAMEPPFVYLNHADNHDGGSNSITNLFCTDSECPSARGFADSNWLFRHVPPTYIRDAFRWCTWNWTTCIDWVVSDKNMDETKSWDLHGRSMFGALAAEYVNLKIQLQWSEWSPCDEGTSTRTREGRHCYLKKIDPSRGVGQLIKGFFSSSDIFNWVEKLKNHMSKIPEFNKTGIRLYSGLISKVIFEAVYGSHKAYDNCYTPEEIFFKNPKAIRRWYDAIFETFGINSVQTMLDVRDRLCLHYYSKPKTRNDDAPFTALVGTHVIDTRRCPPQ